MPEEALMGAKPVEHGNVDFLYRFFKEIVKFRGLTKILFYAAVPSLQNLILYCTMHCAWIADTVAFSAALRLAFCQELRIMKYSIIR